MISDQLAFPRIDENNCWNPFDVNNGRNMERHRLSFVRVPEAYKSRQRRAITLRDYVDRAEEISNVSKASAGVSMDRKLENSKNIQLILKAGLS